MIKSRICILITVVLMMISSVCFASDKWETVQQDSKGIILLDTENVVLYVIENDLYVDCWLKKSIFQSDENSLEHTYIQASDFKYRVTECSMYKGNKFIGNEDCSNQGWQYPVTNSRQERAILNTLHWVYNHKEKTTVKRI